MDAWMDAWMDTWRKKKKTRKKNAKQKGPTLARSARSALSFACCSSSLHETRGGWFKRWAGGAMARLLAALLEFPVNAGKHEPVRIRRQRSGVCGAFGKKNFFRGHAECLVARGEQGALLDFLQQVLLLVQQVLKL